MHNRTTFPAFEYDHLMNSGILLPAISACDSLCSIYGHVASSPGLAFGTSATHVARNPGARTFPCEPLSSELRHIRTCGAIFYSGRDSLAFRLISPFLQVRHFGFGMPWVCLRVSPNQEI